MANTSINEVFDLFMQTVTDYRLIALFNASEPDFENYLQSFLEFAITDFKICDQNLDYSSVTKEFPDVLSRENKNLLVHLMMKYWLQKNVNDITQMNLHVTDRFKIASEALNLREKTAHLNSVKEQCSQMLIDYGYSRVNWTNWINQDFMGV